jgi:hypothetical protein
MKTSLTFKVYNLERRKQVNSFFFFFGLLIRYHLLLIYASGQAEREYFGGDHENPGRNRSRYLPRDKSL